MPKCLDCSEVYPDHMRRCPHCGDSPQRVGTAPILATPARSARAGGVQPPALRFRRGLRARPMILLVGVAALGLVAFFAIPRSGSRSPFWEEGELPEADAPAARSIFLGPPDAFEASSPSEGFAVTGVEVDADSIRVSGTCAPRGVVRVLVAGQPAALSPAGDRFVCVLHEVGARVEAVAEGLDGKRARLDVEIPLSAMPPAAVPSPVRSHADCETVHARVVRLRFDTSMARNLAPHADLDLRDIENRVRIGESQFTLFRAPPGLTYLRTTARGQRTLLRAADGQEMVLIPAGIGMRGAGDKPPLGPAHLMFLRPYLIDRSEVTAGQYEEFLAYMRRMNDAAVRHPEDPGVNLRPAGWTSDSAPAGTETYPVRGLSWYAAFSYARWVGGRLPTEAEWERAAAGPDGLAYPWGATLDSTLCVTKSVGPAPADSLPEGEGPFSLLHTSGNVREWCLDRFEPRWYMRSSRVDPQGPAEGGHRVVRGGSYESDPATLALQWRDHADPASRALDIGFRVVRDWVD
ncbi:MAG: formylglycine-generating enzyme family protein [Planctomycetaceae bacterium]